MPSLSLVIVDNIQHDLAKFSIDQTCQHITPDEIVVFSDKDFYPGSRFVSIKKSITVYDYSELILKHLRLHLNTDFALIIQFDGMAVNGAAWTDEFYNYDYIGAPWPWFPTGSQVGNGGFSLRSHRLISALRDQRIQLGNESGELEDIAICREFRPYLETKYNIKFAPTSLAKQFSVENIDAENPFGFHGIWNAVRFLNKTQLEYIIEHMPDHVWKTSCKYQRFFELLAEKNYIDLLEYCYQQIQQT